MTGEIPFYFKTNYKPLIVIFEPSCEEVTLDPYVSLELIIFFKKIERLETYLTDKTLTIYLWAGCRAKLLINGIDRTPSILLKPC